MDPVAFLVEISKRAGEPLDVHDPLAAAEAFIAEAGDTAEARLLRRLIYAVAFDFGKFKEAEMWLLSRPTLQLVSALREAKLAGRYSASEWARVR